MLTWVVRFEHWSAPGESPETAARIAEILCRPCFAACKRVNWGRRDRWSGHAAKSPSLIREYLLDQRNDAVLLNSGRVGELVASAHIHTGTLRFESIPLSFHAIVPCPDDTTALEEAAFDLALALHAPLGAMSVFPVYRSAERFGFAETPTPERAREIGLSERHHKEWLLLGRQQVQIDTEIPGPEWGLFLGPGHLAKLPVSTLRASGAFAEVRELGLGKDRAFLRLTDDPRDALAPGFEAQLDRARVALAPILADLSRLD